MKINKRLEKIAKYVEKNSNVIDVGCDHALLSIYLVLNDISNNVVASDINKKPLEQASQNIKLYGLSDFIKVKLSDGISKIGSSIDTIIISGMGGKNIRDILLKDKEKLKKIKRIILSPNNNFNIIREILNDIDFKIIKEEIVLENNKFYNIMILEHGNINYSQFEILFGYNILENDDYITYCKYIVEKYKKQLESIPLKYQKQRKLLRNYIKYFEKQIN